MLIFSQNYYFCKIIKFFERNKVRGKLVSVLQIPKKPVESLERMKYTEFVIEAATESQREMLIAELSDYPFDGFTEEEDCLKAYIPEADFRMWRSAIEESLERNRCRYTAAEVPDRNWNTVWESNFEPIDVEGRCRIRAPFHSKNPACEYDVEIMPKMSFGTGHHATTYLMAAEIMDVDFAGKSGLDMGSGTGVLSILAVKQGSRTGRCRRYRRVGISQRDREYKGQRNGRTDRPVAGRRVFAGRETLRFRAGQY